MKNLIRTVETVFFQDDATGDFGLTHKETFDGNNPFNAFWTGMGIFHDVFEHAHEYTDKHFRGDFAMNVGGEMTAMGAMFYYLNTLGVSTRTNRNGRYWSTDELTINGTISEIQESISDGYTRYGSTLLSNVGRQKEINHYGFESMLDEYVYRAKQLKVKTHYEQERADAIQYKKSVTAAKIKNLHRYGYRMAENLVPDNNENLDTLNEFCTVWDKFVGENNAQEMSNTFEGITFNLYKDENDVITWEAELISKFPSEISNHILTPANIGYFSIEETYIMQEDEN